MLLFGRVSAGVHTAPLVKDFTAFARGSGLAGLWSARW